MADERDRTGDGRDDVTRAMPADIEATRAMPVDDEVTQKIDAATRKATPQIWAARASVPVHDVEPVSGPATTQWQEEAGDENAGRSWLRPVVIALIALVLLAILATGLWLIFNRSGGRSAPAPAVSATSSAIPTPTATPPTTEAPTAPMAPATTAAARVSVPDLVGQGEAEAKRQLTAVGLSFTVSRRAASGASPGTVTATEPGAGTLVAPGTRVTLIVAAAPQTATPTRSATPTPSTSISPRPMIPGA